MTSVQSHNRTESQLTETAQLVLGWAPRYSRQEDLNCFFIVGAPRAGTTALGRYLKKHPTICFSNPKETHFFLTADDNTAPEVLKSRYLKAFFPNIRRQARLLGEGSVSTLYSAKAIGRVQACFPQAKFIVMLRNPLDLLRSYHGRLLYLRQEREEDFETAWDLQEARAAGQKIPKSCRDSRVLQYGDVGSLGRYTRQLFDLAGRQNCHAIFFEDFVSDTLCVYKEALRFLNLPYDGQTNFQKKNSQRYYNNAFWQDLYSGPLLRPLGSLLTKHPVRLAQVQRFTRPVRKMIKRENSTEITLPELDPNFAARLLRALGEDIDRLSYLLDRDLTHWLAAGDPLRRGLICHGKGGLG
jgi:hypothetical protein